MNKYSFKDTVKWALVGQILFYLTLFLSNIFFSNVLSINEYSKIVVISFLLTILRMLIDSGLSGALVRKGFANNDDYFILLIYNVSTSILTFILLCFFDYLILMFFKSNLNKTNLLYIGFILIISSFYTVYNTRMIIELKYKIKSFIELISIVFSFLIIIVIWYQNKNLGIELFLLMQILNVLIALFLSYFILQKFQFKNVNFSNFKKLYKFGIITSINSFFNIFFDNISQIILLKYFSTSLSSYYLQANKNQDIPFTIFRALNLGVYFSKLSKYKDSEHDFNLVNSKIKINSLVVVLIVSSFFIFYCDSFFLIVYSDKWANSIYYTRILIVGSIFLYLDSYSRMYFKIFDKALLLLKIDLIKKFLYSISIFLSIYFHDFNYLLFGYLAINILGFYLNNWSILNQIKFNIDLHNSFIHRVLIITSIFIALMFYLSYFFNFNFIQKIYLLPLFVIFYYFLIKKFITIKISNLFSFL
jgi:teichuronic acid exporter